MVQDGSGGKYNILMIFSKKYDTLASGVEAGRLGEHM